MTSMGCHHHYHTLHMVTDTITDRRPLPLGHNMPPPPSAPGTVKERAEAVTFLHPLCCSPVSIIILKWKPFLLSQSIKSLWKGCVILFPPLPATRHPPPPPRQLFKTSGSSTSARALAPSLASRHLPRQVSLASSAGDFLSENFVRCDETPNNPFIEQTNKKYYILTKILSNWKVSLYQEMR